MASCSRETGSGIGNCRASTCQNTKINRRNEVDIVKKITIPGRFSKNAAQNVGIGATVISGAGASAVGVIAAGSSSTAAISAVGAAVGGTAGGVIGSGVGLATGGVGMAATIPFAAGGAAIGSWAGPALALVGIGTAPAWAVPVAIGGAALATCGLVAGAYKFGKARAKKTG